MTMAFGTWWWMLWAAGCAKSGGGGACVPQDPGTWSACDGTRQTVSGRASQNIANHPISAGPGQVQLYLDVANTQIVVLASSDPGCEGAMSATGELRVVDLGGKPGTMNSYRGLVVDAAEVVCR
ncbi:MAG: hypothetical protein H6735_04475 [Alphaproteobacteria bacterium]|nr:hypothetical protein [Alphaproteobacteria bacterium]